MAELKRSVLDHLNFVATIWQGEIVQMNTLEAAEMHNGLAYSDLWMSFSAGLSLQTKLKRCRRGEAGPHNRENSVDFKFNFPAILLVFF